MIRLSHPNGCRIEHVQVNPANQGSGPFIHITACGARFEATAGVPFQQTTAYQEWLAHTCLTTTRSAS